MTPARAAKATETLDRLRDICVENAKKAAERWLDGEGDRHLEDALRLAERADSLDGLGVILRGDWP